jgi:uncharacterized protein (TIGR02231 family)
MTARAGFLWLAAFVLVQPATRVAASEIHADSPIVAVTVFPDRVQVTRRLDVALPQGQSTLVVSGLPASLFPDSVRVDGEAGGTVVIASVETRRQFSEDTVQQEERRLRHEIEALGDQSREQADRIAASRVQLDFIASIGREMPKSASEEIVRGAMDPEKWRQAWSLLGAGAAEIYEQIHKAEIEQRTIARRIEQKNRELGQIGTGRKTTVEARIKVEAAQPSEAGLRLSYQLNGASWRPLYDARLDTESEKIALAQIGEVRQRTGENWSDVELTLSTARPALSARLPELETWFVDVAEVMPATAGFADRKILAQTEVAEKDVLTPSAMEKAEPKAAAVVSSEFAAEYRIAGAVDIPSDGEPRKFPIAERSMDARLAVQSVPKVSPLAYLYGDIEFAGDEPLLPGPVSIFKDGAFVGGGVVEMLRPGEAFKLSFGIDDRVRIDYRLETGERSREGLINKNRRIERHYIVDVANHHGRPIDITVLDQLPVPMDERIDVELLKGSTRPTEQDVEDRKGVLAWTYTYEANEERAIRFGYALSHPEDVAVPGF